MWNLKSGKNFENWEFKLKQNSGKFWISSINQYFMTTPDMSWWFRGRDASDITRFNAVLHGNSANLWQSESQVKIRRNWHQIDCFNGTKPSWWIRGQFASDITLFHHCFTWKFGGFVKVWILRQCQVNFSSISAKLAPNWTLFSNLTLLMIPWPICFRYYNNNSIWLKKDFFPRYFQGYFQSSHLLLLCCSVARFLSGKYANFIFDCCERHSQ